MTGAVMWDSGVVLGKFLEHAVDSGKLALQGKKVIELGSGCGLVGYVASRILENTWCYMIIGIGLVEYVHSTLMSYSAKNLSAKSPLVSSVISCYGLLIEIILQDVLIFCFSAALQLFWVHMLF